MLVVDHSWLKNTLISLSFTMLMAKPGSISTYLYNLLIYVPLNALHPFTHISSLILSDFNPFDLTIAMLYLPCVKAKHIYSAGEKRCEVMGREWSSSRFQLFGWLAFEGGFYHDISSKQ